MNRIQLLAIGSTLTLSLILTAAARQAGSTSSGDQGVSQGEKSIVPSAAEQLTFLAGKLNLTNDQQEKMKPILREMHDATMKVMQDESLSREDRMSKLRDSHYKADAKIRVILNDEQKKKLDQVEHEPHPELHGNLNDAKN